MEWMGYIGVLLAGVLLGILGSGGSILIVPVLVYFMLLDPIAATTFSLFMVGISSLMGSFLHRKKYPIQLRIAFLFAIPAAVTIYVTRSFLIPIIPDRLFTVLEFTLTKSTAIMILFSFVMLLSAVSMIRGQRRRFLDSKANKYVAIVFEGTVVGFVAGMVGAGGGFLIIPALVILFKLPMKQAVVTSLLIITINSLVGFVGSIHLATLDWGLLFTLTVLSILGTLGGVWASRFIHEKPLKRIFAYFLLAVAAYILVREFTLL